MILFKTGKNNIFAPSLKKAISIVFVFLLIFSNLSRIWILIDFKVNQDFIAKVLCINKNKPELQCNGKCHLANQIKQQEKKENTGTTAEANTKLEILFFNHFTTDIPLSQDIALQTKLHSPYLNVFHSSDYLDQLLRPPQLS